MSIETIYQEILKGERKRFPRHTWEKDNYGYENFTRCLRYITKKKNLNREEIVDIDHNFIKRHKLRGGLVMLYDDKLKSAILNAFPEFDFKEWEFFRTSKNEEFVKVALREMVK